MALRFKLWGTRGSIACAGPDTVRYGGDTSAVEVRTDSGRLIVLDAGSGVRPLGGSAGAVDQVDVLLSHLHMDHVQGLPFFGPLLDPDVRVDIWGPVSTTLTLRQRLARYLSPPLFPVRVRDLPNVWFHDVLPGRFELDGVGISADLISHPGSTLGYRLEAGGSVLTYMPDHEPALGCSTFPLEPEWTSGYPLARDADVLIHDFQYTDEEYATRVGWGHSAHSHVLAYAELAKVGTLVTFHHDPGHSDDALDRIHSGLEGRVGFRVIAGKPGVGLEV